MSQALALVREAGLGCEVASSGELQQALRVGFAPADIVYDEPAKTTTILKFALQHGVNFNIDNLQEFNRVRALRADDTPESRIGFRINPQVGSGKIGAMSTATNTSKFGVALYDPDMRDSLVQCYAEHAWLNSLHTHIGSQGCSLDLMVRGIRNVVDFVEAVNEHCGEQRIQTIDIGGGLPVNFTSDDVSPSFQEYSDALRGSVPELFDGRYRVKTEFGRSLFAKNGIIVTKVEYTKESGGRRIAITHAGAQTATRTAFVPDLWAIRLSIYDQHGTPKAGRLIKQDVAGPCCFAGDLLAVGRELPLIEPDDYVVLHDTGAYYFSNPFYYNSLPPIAVYGGTQGKDGAVVLETWREQQSMDELLAVVG